ncbi:MAG: hypothetical protein IEMM0008_0854 [bacterium]|nr:MAG: hypothetical protein IEMM0008_0854 [bacterium]
MTYSLNDVILVKYPFSDLSHTKIRPAVVIHSPLPTLDLFIVPLTSKTEMLLDGEFVLSHWAEAGLNVTTAVKRGIYTIHHSLVIKTIGSLSDHDADQLKKAIKLWLNL